MPGSQTLYDHYSSELLKDAEFRAPYARAKHKVHLEFLFETARTHREKKSAPETLLADIQAIKRYPDQVEIGK